MKSCDFSGRLDSAVAITKIPRLFATFALQNEAVAAFIGTLAGFGTAAASDSSTRGSLPLRARDVLGTAFHQCGHLSKLYLSALFASQFCG